MSGGVALGLVAAVLAAAGPAAASWSVAGTGSGSAQSRTLPPVGAVSAVCGGGASVAVSWAASDLSTAYVVERSVNLGPWAVVRPAAPATSFTDTGAGVLDATIRWRVTGLRSAWSAQPSDPSATRVISPLGSCG